MISSILIKSLMPTIRKFIDDGGLNKFLNQIRNEYKTEENEVIFFQLNTERKDGKDIEVIYVLKQLNATQSKRIDEINIIDLINKILVKI